MISKNEIYYVLHFLNLFLINGKETLRLKPNSLELPKLDTAFVGTFRREN